MGENIFGSWERCIIQEKISEVHSKSEAFGQKEAESFISVDMTLTKCECYWRMYVPPW